MSELQLSDKAMAVMQLIAKGHSYEQILSHRADLTYRDIFDAAEGKLGDTKDYVDHSWTEHPSVRRNARLHSYMNATLLRSSRAVVYGGSP